MSVAGVGDDEPAFADAAIDTALEVVLVASLALSGEVVSLEDVLDPLPGLGADERLVLAVVLGAPVANDALVVRVDEDAVEVGEVERPGGTLAGTERFEARSVEFLQQIVKRPVAGGVGLEGPFDEWRTDRVDFDGADFAAVLDSADVVAWFPVADPASNIITLFAQATCQRQWDKKMLEPTTQHWAPIFKFTSPVINILLIPYCFRQPDGSWFSKIKVLEGVLFDRVRILGSIEADVDLTAAWPEELVKSIIAADKQGDGEFEEAA